MSTKSTALTCTTCFTALAAAPHLPIRPFRRKMTCFPPRRPRSPCNTSNPRRPAPRLCLPSASLSSSSPPSVPPPAEECYLQCPGCLAMYQVDADELEGPPRVVACSACLHEWHAAESDLIWGDEAALDALKNPTVDISPARSDSKAFVAARGVNSSKRRTSQAISKSAPGNGASTEAIVKQSEDRAADIASDIPIGEASSSDDEPLGTLDGDLESDESEDYGRTEESKTLASNGDVSSDSAAFPSDLDDGGFQEATSETPNREPDQSGTAYNKSKGTASSDSTVPTRNSKNGEEKDANFSVFVGNLSYRATEEDLYRAFSGYGAVLRCQVPSDSSGTSKGYGFVEMRTRESGLRAIESLQGTCLLGRDISLHEARPKTFTPRKVGRPGGVGRDGRRRRGPVANNERRRTPRSDSSRRGSWRQKSQSPTQDQQS